MGSRFTDSYKQLSGGRFLSSKDHSPSERPAQSVPVNPMMPICPSPPSGPGGPSKQTPRKPLGPDTPSRALRPDERVQISVQLDHEENVMKVSQFY